MNIYDLFDHQLKLNPDAIAVIAEGETATYAQLAAQVDDISKLLAQQGLIPEQAIGVLMQRSVQMIATLLAVLKLGYAYMPLEPSDPVERHRQMLDISGCQLVLTNNNLEQNVQAALDKQPAKLIVQFIPVDKLAVLGTTSSLLSATQGGSQLAYIMFTSGSTGEPKGVEIEHRNVINLLLGVRDLIGFTSADRYLAMATIAFDISVVELFLPLVCGGSLLLRDRQLLIETDKLLEDVSRYQVSIMQTSATLWVSILAQQPDFPKLRVAISTSEALSREAALKLLSYGEQVWNLYGPTETTVWATAYQLTEASCQAGKGSNISVHIGQGIANAEAYVLDKNRQPVSEDESGELCIGGLGLARGYLNDNELTARQFIRHQETGKRLYRTGDLVAWSSELQLSYLGRIDDQIQVHGVRVEPREVEASILKNPYVQEVAATWYETSFAARAIVAAVVLKPKKQLAAGELHNWLADRLPRAMLPSKIIIKQRLALTASDKIDYNAIRAEIAPSALSTEPSRVSGSAIGTEAVLAQIWQSLLALELVAAEDHFFAIGGDSLAAVRMILEVESCMHVQLNVQMVYESPTLAGFSARIEQLKAAPDNSQESAYVFQLSANSGGRPVFFNNANLSIASGKNWKLPCPLYSISYWAKGSGFLEFDSLEELAAAHIAEIRKIQAQGPYRLAGFSFGGLIAFEIARQLSAYGETVESLFLVEPREPDGISLAGKTVSIIKHESLLERIIRHLKVLLKQPGEGIAYLEHRLIPTLRTNPFTRWLAYKIMNMSIRRKHQVATLLVPKNQGIAIRYYIDRLISDYVAQPYSGPVRAVFGDYNEYGYMANTWTKLIGEDNVFHIPEANHSSLFSEPALSEWQHSLARQLNVDLS